MTRCVLTTLTGIIFRRHCCALILHHTNSDNSDIVGTSRLEIIQQEGVVFSPIGASCVGHAEVVLTMVHAQRTGPGKGDGVHSLRLHRDGARRVWNWTGEGIHQLMVKILAAHTHTPCCTNAQVCNSWCNSQVALYTVFLFTKFPLWVTTSTR